VILHFGESYDTFFSTNHDSMLAASTRELFKEIDADGNGVLDVDELQILMGRANLDTSDIDLHASIMDMDADGDGNVSYHDFEAWWVKQQHQQQLNPVAEVTVSKKKKKSGSGIGDAFVFLSKEIEKQKEDAARKETSSQILDMVDAFKGLKRDHLEMLFNALDVDNNGTLDKEEVERLISQVLKKGTVSPLLLETLWLEMDGDGSGAVDINEFATFFGVV